LNNNQYLTTITDANNVLSNHHFDNNKSNKTKKTDKKLKSDNNVKKEEQEIPLSFAQLKGKCYCCGKPGHRSPQCCEKDLKPHEEWFIHKAESHMQASGNADTASEGSNKSNDTKSNQGTLTRRVRWAGVHMTDLQFHQADAMHKCILLDSCSSTMIWSNPDMVSNIRETNKMLDLTTNAGVLSTNKKAYLPGWGDVWFSTDLVTNIFSLAQVSNCYCVTYDNNKEDAIIFHMPDKEVKFQYFGNNLYIYIPPQLKKKSEGILHKA
jgi:hypothetical protein